MPPCCLATGRWGAARCRLDTLAGLARDPAPWPRLVLWRIDRLTWRKQSHYYRNAKRHYVLDTNDWPLLYYDFIETCSFLQRPLPLLNKETVQEMVRIAHRIGLIKSPQVVICEKKVFCSLNFFCEKFPIKHCSTHSMWIRWSFRNIWSSYFHWNIMYIWLFAHPRLTTYQLDWTRMLYKRK